MLITSRDERGLWHTSIYMCVLDLCVFDWAMGEERGRRATETDGTQDTDTTETVERRLVTSRRVNYECVFASLSVRLFFQSSQINKRKKKERKKEVEVISRKWAVAGATQSCVAAGCSCFAAVSSSAPELLVGFCGPRKKVIPSLLLSIYPSIYLSFFFFFFLLFFFFSF